MAAVPLTVSNNVRNPERWSPESESTTLSSVLHFLQGAKPEMLLELAGAQQKEREREGRQREQG